ncbi:Bax inhibitor-1/YccA family protein [Glycomyces sp. YM15]|uniref:Bax inhibitor-1/YccA family membrane protein n=1 Tax=Glycomyces sp. YM15 TaxID=2800446 RepID=UPI0023DD5831|nr:Bax inhibitor-1/YccA family protein [Glycomyces sp. YM15]
MARGNPLLNRLARVQSQYPVTSAGGRMTAAQVSERASVLLGVTLVAGAAAWFFMTAQVDDATDWPGWESNLIGIAGLVVAAGFLIAGSLRPMPGAAAAVAYAVAQGLGLAWIGVAFDLGSGGFVANLLLGTVLTGPAALAVLRSRWGALPALVVVPVSAAIGLAALASVNAVAFLAGGDAGLFGGVSIPWWGWWSLALLALWSAYSFGVDMRRLDEYVNAGAEVRYVWAAALAIAAGPIGIYAWRLSDFRSTHSSDTYDYVSDAGDPSD